jgi:hypothetical protein
MAPDRMSVAFVISDVDGTLVNKAKEVTDATVAAVHRLEAAGLPFSLISARPASGILWIADKLGLKGPIAAFNGGTVLEADGTVIERHVLDEAVVRQSFALAEGKGAVPWLFAGGIWHCPDTDSPHVPHEVLSAGQQPTVRQDMAPLFADVDKLTWVSDDEPMLKALEAEMKEAIGSAATIARSQTYYLDLTHPTANKGNGVETLARIAGMDLARVAVLGDQHNDLPMFARAGISIAMGQAPDDVQDKANYVSTSNDQDGVAHAIDAILLPMLGKS